MATGAKILRDAPYGDTVPAYSTSFVAVITLGDASPSSSQSNPNAHGALAVSSNSYLQRFKVPVLVIAWFIECLVTQRVILPETAPQFSPSFDL